MLNCLAAKVAAFVISTVDSYSGLLSILFVLSDLSK
jgi:hypothetical protein